MAIPEERTKQRDYHNDSQINLDYYEMDFLGQLIYKSKYPWKYNVGFF